jgi:hypothetical protein
MKPFVRQPGIADCSPRVIASPVEYLRRLQVTLSASKLGARVGIVQEKTVPLKFAFACIDEKIKELGNWRAFFDEVFTLITSNYGKRDPLKKTTRPTSQNIESPF